MANLQQDPNDELPQQINTDAPSTSRRLTSSSTVAERSSANRKHHEELISHTLNSASYNAHGHAVGKQGARGHTMVQSDHAKQGTHAYIPQGVLGAPQNRQNTFSDSGSADADDVSTGASDYGKVDKG